MRGHTAECICRAHSAEFEFAAWSTSIQTAIGAHAVKTGTRGLSHLRGAWVAAAGLRPASSSLQRPGTHGAAAAASARAVGKEVCILLISGCPMLLKGAE
jgi:hypothetical protein